MAKAIVVEIGSERIALVGLDLGRAPTGPMMEENPLRRSAGSGSAKRDAGGFHTSRSVWNCWIARDSERGDLTRP